MRAYSPCRTAWAPILTVLACMQGSAQRPQQLRTQPQTAVTAPSRSTIGSPSTARRMAAGTVTGYVFWDTQRVAYTPSVPCQGLQVDLSALTGTGKEALGVSNQFQYTQSTRPGVGLGQCSYNFQHVPEGVTLQVQVSVGQPFASQVTTKGPFGASAIKIPGGQCNNPSSGTAMTSLESGWQSCGERVFNVNFQLVPRNTTGALTPQKGGLLQQAPGANTQPSGMLKGNSPGLLSGGASTPVLINPGPIQTPIGAAQSSGAGARNGGVNPGNTAQLNPQPLPPRQTSSEANAPVAGSLNKGNPVSPGAKGATSRAGRKPLKLSSPKALTKVTNPRLTQQNASIIAVLEQQRKAAALESAAMKPGKGSIASAATERTATLAGFHGTAPVQGLPPEQTQSIHGKAASLAHESYFNSIVITCSHDPTPRVLQVSGGQGRGIFTPESKYNLYTIVGCSFGPSDSGNSAYIFGLNGFKANLNIDFWSENGITVHLDPWLAGVLDQDNVTLVVAPAAKQPFQKGGYSFYAARGMPGPDGNPQEVQLIYDSMPQSGIKPFDVANFLAGIDQLPSNATSNFPSFSFQGTPVAGWIFRYGVYRRDSFLRTADCYINDVGFKSFKDGCEQFFYIGDKDSWQLKSDTWNFSQFAPGFQITSYGLYVSNLDPATLCGAWDDSYQPKQSYLEGNWDYNLNGQNQIVVTWPVYRCWDEELQRDNVVVQSAYGVAVWVLGPRCVGVWNGQRDENCMSKIKQILH